MDDVVLGVAGWLAVTLQAGPGHQAPLGAAEQVTIDVRTGAGYRSRTQGWDGPPLEVQWRGGPLADTVADQLAALPDPRFPVTRQKTGVVVSRAHADVLVGEVWVMLNAHDADPDAEAGFVAAQRPPRWEDPLVLDGTAYAVTVQQPDPDPGTAAVAVLHRAAAEWPQRGRLVVDLQHDLPDWAGPDRAIAYDRGRFDAQVRLHTARTSVYSRRS